jgi:DNA-binding Xre family transcriptional regulator
MIQIRIRERCLSRGITTAYQLQKAANLTPPTAYRAFNDKIKQVTMETLDKLCTALDCQPHMLFHHEKLEEK